LIATLVGVQETATDVTAGAVCAHAEAAASRLTTQHKINLEKAKPGGERSARLDVLALI
jgi:hypothetical protein